MLVHTEERAARQQTHAVQSEGPSCEDASPFCDAAAEAADLLAARGEGRPMAAHKIDALRGSFDWRDRSQAKPTYDGPLFLYLSRIYC